MGDPDFDARWAEIVADLTTADAIEGAESAPAPGRDADQADPGSQDQSVGGADAPDAGLAALFEPLRRREPTTGPATSSPDAFVDSWQDEGEFVPPAPPALPEGTPIKRLGWAGTLGGLATLVIVGLTGWPAPRIVPIAAGLAMLAGFVTLVWQLPESREDGWDDGAQL